MTVNSLESKNLFNTAIVRETDKAVELQIKFK